MSDLKMLKDREAEALVESMARMRGGVPSGEDARDLIMWAERALLDHAVLELALKGMADLDWDGGEGQPIMRITSRGASVAREIAREGPVQ